MNRFQVEHMHFIVRSIWYKILLHMALAFLFVSFCIYTMSDKYEHTEQCSVIKFLVRKNKTNTKIMKELTSVYGTQALKSTAVKKWVGRFQSGTELVDDNARAGRPCTVCNKRSVEKVK